MSDVTSKLEVLTTRFLEETLEQLSILKEQTHTPKIPQSHSQRFPVTIAIAAISILGVFLLLAFMAGILDKPSNQTEGETLTAVLLLVGVIITETIVVVGILLGHYSDMRSHRLAEIEQARLIHDTQQSTYQRWVELSRHALQAQQERQKVSTEIARLEQELTFSALEALGKSNASTADYYTAITALFTTGSINVGVSLLGFTWERGESGLTTHAAVSLIDQVLTNRDATEVERVMALELLCTNAAALLDGGKLHLPAAIQNGKIELTEPVATKLFDCLVAIVDNQIASQAGTGNYHLIGIEDLIISTTLGLITDSNSTSVRRLSGVLFDALGRIVDREASDSELTEIAQLRDEGAPHLPPRLKRIVDWSHWIADSA